MRHLDCTEVCGKSFLGFERTGILLVIFCLLVAFCSWLLHIASLMISLQRGCWKPWPFLSVVKPCVAAPLCSEASFINISPNTALYPVSGDARESQTIAGLGQKAALWRGRRGGRAGGAREPLRAGTIVPLIGFLLVLAGPGEPDPPGPTGAHRDPLIRTWQGLEEENDL